MRRRTDFVEDHDDLLVGVLLEDLLLEGLATASKGITGIQDLKDDITLQHKSKEQSDNIQKRRRWE